MANENQLEDIKQLFEEYGFPKDYDEDEYNTYCLHKQLNKQDTDFLADTEEMLKVFQKYDLIKDRYSEVITDMTKVEAEQFLDLVIGLEEHKIDVAKFLKKRTNGLYQGKRYNIDFLVSTINKYYSTEGNEQSLGATMVQKCTLLTAGEYGYGFDEKYKFFTDNNINGRQVLSSAPSVVMNSSINMNQVYGELKKLENKKILNALTYVEAEPSVLSVRRYREIGKVVTFVERLGLNVKEILRKLPSVLFSVNSAVYTKAYTTISDEGYSKLYVECVKNNPNVLKDWNADSVKYGIDKIKLFYGAKNVNEIITNNNNLLNKDCYCKLSSMVQTLTPIYQDQAVALEKLKSIKSLIKAEPSKVESTYEYLMTIDKYKNDPSKAIKLLENYPERFNLRDIKTLINGRVKNVKVARPKKTKRQYKEIGKIYSNEAFSLPITIYLNGNKSGLNKAQNELLMRLLELADSGNKKEFETTIKEYFGAKNTSRKITKKEVGDEGNTKE